MTEDLAHLSNEQLRSLADRMQKELARRDELLKRSIRSEFDARLTEAGLTVADIYPDEVQGRTQAREKKQGARMVARALFLMR